LFFANAGLFNKQVANAISDSPTPVKRVIIAAEPVTSVDITSADMLAELKETLDTSEVELHFAEMKDPVKDKLKRFKLLQILGTDIFHPTIGAAIDNYLEKYKIEWKP
jgi:MFS superfamily sulfate permease-like transporter